MSIESIPNPGEAIADRAPQTPRRGFLRALGILALSGTAAAARGLPAGAPGLPAPAPAPAIDAALDSEPVDADLFGLVTQWRAAHGRKRAAKKIVDAAREATIWPAPPAALIERRGDSALLHDFTVPPGAPAADYMLAMHRFKYWERPAVLDGIAAFRRRDKAAQRLVARLADIKAAADDYWSARAAASKASGLSDANAVFYEADKAATAIYEEVNNTAALSLDGAVAKAAVTAESFGGVEALDEWRRTVTVSSGPLGAGVSLMVDLAYMAAPAPDQAPAALAPVAA